ncbi:MAG: inositol monophosphatase [Calditrichaeota bacterium]|nr:inositol monophosphatase [Calditrichota bacterium]
MAQIHHESSSDTIYAIDRISEDLILELFSEKIAAQAPIVLIAEGIGDGKVVLPASAKEEDAQWRIIIDPIDGTREIMYQKRSAWILTGVAPNKGENTNLQDIELAVQTEIPLVKQHLCDVLWAQKGQGVQAERYDRLSQKSVSLALQPSTADTIAHGFAMISRFFPGARDVLAEIDEELIRAVLGPVQKGKTHCFEDQYLSTGGQIYELIAGHDRFNADIRPLMDKVLAKQGFELGICCHPYDICTELIAREAGVVITDEYGQPLRTKLDVDENLCWIGYANEKIRAALEPVLQRILKKRDLI